jgi:hypothetical protein
MISIMDFIINGRTHSAAPADVERVMRGVPPEGVQQHSVVLGGVDYPVKQVLGALTGLARTEFTSHRARDLLQRLGFTTLADGAAVPGRESGPTGTGLASGPEWAWEGDVQDLFATFLGQHGWTILAMADTATKQQGVDVLASKQHRLLGAEVKGWPSKTYADVRRAEEVQPTQPTTQAAHWFSQGLMKAMMLLDSHPDHESLMVLPDYPRYRDLARRTGTSRMAAAVHVVFVKQDGEAESDSWWP